MSHRLINRAAVAALAGLVMAGCTGSSTATGSTHSVPPSETAHVSGAAGGSAASSSSPAAAPTTGPGSAGCAIPPPASPAAGLTLYACYRMTGQVDGEGGFVDEGQGASGQSCTQWAAHGNQPAGTAFAILFLPDPGDAGASLEAQPISFYLEIGPYTGPGAYSSTRVTESARWGSGNSWSTNADPGAGFSAQVNADGSGTVTAAGLRNDNSGHSTETVTESWTCAVAAGG